MVRYLYQSLFAWLLVATALPVSHAATEYDPGLWAAVLEAYVDDRGFVDYAGLSEDREVLDRYLAQVKSTGPESNPELFPDRWHELAFYINAYNALVFEGVLARGPETESVWKGLISGLNFFVRMDILIDGQQTNLRNLENKVIRDRYGDPRIHAALNCASVSCPRLPRMPFDAENLDRELDQAMAEFVANPDHVRVQEDTLYLSKIFDWFEEDFTDFEKSNGNTTPHITDYINRYMPAGQEISPDLKVRYVKYDKGINSQDN